MTDIEQQLVNISKAHAFDIVSKQVGELQEQNAKLLESNRELKRVLGNLLSDVLDLLAKNDSIRLGTMGTIHIVESQKILKDEQG